MQQITLNFEAGLVDCFNTCREYVAARVHQQGRPQKTIAADMDYSPSILSRKLSQSESDTSKFTLDDLETFIQITGDTKPILYLVEKYLSSNSEREALLRRLREIEQDEKVEQLKAVD